MTKPVLVVDNTWLEGTRTCWRFHQYRFEEHLSPALTAAPLNFGIAVHAGEAAANRGLTSAQIEAEVDSHWGLQETREDEWRTVARAKMLVTESLKQMEKLEVLKDKEGNPLVEIEFALPFPISAACSAALEAGGFDPTLMYSGIIDNLVRFQGRVYVRDYKTTSKLAGDTRKGEAKRIPSSYWEQFKPHGASPGYVWAAQHYFHEQVHGVMIEALGVQALANDKINTAFSRMTFEWTEPEIKEWQAEVDDTIQDYLSKRKSGFFRRNPKACCLYNHNCCFKLLCGVPAEAREPMKKMFVVSPWNPLTARKNEGAASE